jgi:hypothetical protein
MTKMKNGPCDGTHDCVRIDVKANGGHGRLRCRVTFGEETGQVGCCYDVERGKYNDRVEGHRMGSDGWEQRTIRPFRLSFFHFPFLHS